MKTKTAVFDQTFPFLLFLLLITPVAPALGAMEGYCVTPPFLTQSISPNILIVLDNSYSMCEQAYPSEYNTAQFTNGLYYGYFDGTKNYQYDGSRWVPTTADMTTGTATNPIANGSFLNWATMRRTEVSKKLLVGGKGNPRSPSPGNTVKLDTQTDCGGWAGEFEKTFDTTGLGLIYPFEGKYKFKTDDAGRLSVGPGYDKVYANADLFGAGSWWKYPTPPNTLYDKINDASPNDSTLISPETWTDDTPIVFDFDYTGAEPAGSIEVIVHIRALKSGNQTRRIKGVLRVNGENKVSDTTSMLTGTDEWHNYSFKWITNPVSGANWTWDQIKQVAGTANLLQGFGVQDSDGNSGDNGGNWVYISQVYLEVGVAPLIPNGGPYRIIVDQGMVKAEGLIDNLDSEVRFGLAYYNNSINNSTDNGGKIQEYVGYGSPVNMITSIENMTPSTNTPLGETLHEMVRYFRQDAPYYPNSPANYSVGSGDMGSPNIFRDPYAYEFTDLEDSELQDMYVKCAKSFILFLTDGESTRDQHMDDTLKGFSAGVMDPESPNARFSGTDVGKTYPASGTDYMIDVAYWARTEDMRPGTCTDVPTTWQKCLPENQNVYLYPIYMFGTGSSLLKDAAIYGGFDDNEDGNNNKPDCITSPSECYRDSNGDGVVTADGRDLPLTYYEGNDGYALEQNIKQAIYEILKRAASSTAVSVLSSSEGSGANLVQSLFYPKRSFSTSADITWTSDVMNYWYYFDPFFKNAQIREDTVRDGGDYTLLDLKSDYITQFYFDSGEKKTQARRSQDVEGEGEDIAVVDTIPIEDAKAIWRAGVNLWWTDPDQRTITTSIDGSTLIPFAASSEPLLKDYLGQSANAGAAGATIEYVRGDDIAKLCSVSRIPCATDVDCGGGGDICATTRNRTAPMKVCATSRNPCATDSDCGGINGDCRFETHTWKLGDVISSTPRIMGPSPLNNYHLKPPIGYADETYADYIATADYKNRQRVFVGSNDGMFHAFRLGKILQNWPGKGDNWWQVGRLEGATGDGGIGTESWAFIPKNALPYLQYLSRPDYCHVYMVDGPVSLADASMNCSNSDYWNCAKQTSSWRSVVIGSMGIGGATNDSADSFCVPTPLNVVDPEGVSSSVGWSSYFAFDVTEPENAVTQQDNPEFLWEFNHPDLGVTNIGPTIVKVGDGKRCTSNNATCTATSDCPGGGECVDANGRWFAIFASGSTGPIDSKEFKGTAGSDDVLDVQTLKLFVLDLKTGELLHEINTGIENAFAGSTSANSVDLEKSNRFADGNYQDDVIYFGYVQNTTNGGVIRLVIDDDINPANWTASKVIENIGPVTTSVVNLLDRKSRKLWLYFAEGRYFYKQDDMVPQRRLFGIEEPCYAYNDIDPACTSTRSEFDLKDQSGTPGNLAASQKGWFIKLDPDSTSAGAERVISNPTPDTLGAIFFLSFAPTTDICGYGGITYLWGLDYKTGGGLVYTVQGKALVQVSTGEIKELPLDEAFTERDGRRTGGFPGVPPTGQGLMIVTNPPPINRYMHIQEQ